MLCLDKARDGDDDLAKAFKDIGAPFNVISIDCQAARDVYQRNYLLLRPDLHVVWRGNDAHPDAEHLAGVATGQRALTSRIKLN